MRRLSGRLRSSSETESRRMIFKSFAGIDWSLQIAGTFGFPTMQGNGLFVQQKLRSKLLSVGRLVLTRTNAALYAERDSHDAEEAFGIRLVVFFPTGFHRSDCFVVQALW